MLGEDSILVALLQKDSARIVPHMVRPFEASFAGYTNKMDGSERGV